MRILLGILSAMLFVGLAACPETQDKVGHAPRKTIDRAQKTLDQAQVNIDKQVKKAGKAAAQAE